MKYCPDSFKPPENDPGITDLFFSATVQSQAYSEKLVGNTFKLFKLLFQICSYGNSPC